MFKNYKIQLIKNNFTYHFPEILETDEEDIPNKRKIVVKDLK